ncbi:hypothetical protein COCCADRAFT_29686 [Bipolaris zeicola 26-R-13]|uniref:Uncharacterized protein n=1 Tax=Cochliobolus carbonum (strain 26-R-13) TaxID=930089 RepID=W6XVJ8_COCC2|nr:uncharacterized protein COCCADRAFT_29686 [Bipolaris zeicola 26-R-13]EUC29210.1 hypothetical protein COCCADRAFT_29686 [Bipolaris zeicola 26-R-13]
MARRGEGSVGLAGWERTQQRQQQANAAGGGRTTGGSRSLQQRNYCGSRQVGDDVWEKQRTKGLYDEGLKKAAKGDALAGMERCHPGKEGPPESSWAGAGHSLLLHHRHHGKTSTTAPPRNPPQPTAHTRTQTLRHLPVRVCRPGAANPPACGLAATPAVTLVAAATACRSTTQQYNNNNNNNNKNPTTKAPGPYTLLTTRYPTCPLLSASRNPSWYLLSRPPAYSLTGSLIFSPLASSSAGSP